MSIRNILITGARAPSSLYLIRKLKNAGYNIFTAESFNYFISKYSNCVIKNYKVSEPNINTPQFINDIIKIIKEENIDLIIPTCEEIFYIAKNKKILEKYCEVFCDEEEKLLELHNKWSFYNKIKNSDYNIKLPKSWYVEKIQDLKKVFEEGKKYVLKPIYSRFAAHTQIINKLPKQLKKGQYIFQEFIEGTQFCSYSIIKNNKIFLHSDYKTVYCADFATTIAFEFADNRKILEFIKDFSVKENFEGQIAFDFIQKGEELYLIECNPRLTSGIQLFDEGIQRRNISKI